ncbi:NUDIX hydrolase [Salinactinospora qingdaonensis]
MVDEQGERAFFESLPRSRGAATALVCDGAGRVLVVKPTYKPGWSLPGGVIEQGESPLAACRRECAEEIGFVPVVTRLAGVDWMPPRLHPDGRAATVFVFAAQMGRRGVGDVRLAVGELSDVALVAVAELGSYVPAAMLRRVRACLATSSAVYLEHGWPAAGLEVAQG